MISLLNLYMLANQIMGVTTPPPTKPPAKCNCQDMGQKDLR